MEEAQASSGSKTLLVIGDDPDTRETTVLLAYLTELDRQADFALKAMDDLLRSGAQAVQPNDFETWYSAQALLTALGIIRHLLLGNDIRGSRVSSGQVRSEAKERGIRRGNELRTLLNLPDGNVLLSAEVRNAFEHFDEWLDEATEEPYVIDTAIYTQPERIRYYSDEAHDHEIEPLRQLDVGSGHLIFKSDALDLFAVRHDLRLLKKRIVRTSEQQSIVAQSAVGVFGKVARWIRIGPDGEPIAGDPFPEDPDVDD